MPAPVLAVAVRSASRRGTAVRRRRRRAGDQRDAVSINLPSAPGSPRVTEARRCRSPGSQLVVAARSRRRLPAGCRCRPGCQDRAPGSPCRAGAGAGLPEEDLAVTACRRRETRPVRSGRGERGGLVPRPGPASGRPPGPRVACRRCAGVPLRRDMGAVICSGQVARAGFGPAGDLAGAWNGSWNGSPGIPALPVPSVRFSVLSVQLLRSVNGAVVMVRRRSTVRFRNGSPGHGKFSNYPTSGVERALETLLSPHSSESSHGTAVTPA